MQFKVGDRVRIVREARFGYPHEGNFSGYGIGYEFVIAEISQQYNIWCRENLGISSGVTESLLELVNQSLTNKQMNIKESFVLAITPEPKKSFRKAGITNGDDMLTADGQNIFLTWLLHSKHADEFKTGVVDGLLAEQEK